MAHFLSEGTALGALGLAVDERGQGGVSIPAPIAQGIDSSPPALVSPTTTMEPRPPAPPPTPTPTRRAAETQPDWIQDPWEPVLHRKFPGVSF